MTRIHDMGGRFGDGPVVPEEVEPVFHAPWHGRALAITLACGSHGKWNIDTSRHARECLAPGDYARFHYYEKWLAGLADLLVAKGLVSREELSGEAAPVPSEAAQTRLRAEAVPAVLARGGPSLRESDVAPLFSAGDAVMTRAIAESIAE